MIDTSTALARTNGAGPSVSATGDLADTQQLGKLLAESGFFVDTKGMAQAVVKVLAGRELGISAIAAMTGIFIVKGKVTLSANLMAAVVKRSGRYTYKIKRLDDTGCVLLFYERSLRETKWDLIGESEFTMTQARTAKLPQTNPGTWDAYPRNMLFARAMSNGAKWYCPDLWGGPVYTPDELGEVEQIDAEPPTVHVETVTAEPEPAALTPRSNQVLAAIDRGMPVGGHAPAPAKQPATPAKKQLTDAELAAKVGHLIDKADLLGLAVPDLPPNATRQQLIDIGTELHEAIKEKEAEMDAIDDAAEVQA